MTKGQPMIRNIVTALILIPLALAIAVFATLRAAFRGDIAAPVRHHHAIGNAMLLLMPAWTTAAQGVESFLGCKVVTVFPDNGKVAKPAVLGSYILMSGQTGEPLAVM